MKVTPVWSLVVVVASTLALAGGGCVDPGRVRDGRSPAEHFKAEQAATVTPHGKIMIDSVQEKDGKIEYKTEDGKHWRVSYSKRADGKYQYGTPEEVK